MPVLYEAEEIEMTDFGSSEHSFSDCENSSYNSDSDYYSDYSCSSESDCDDYAPIHSTKINNSKCVFTGSYAVEEKDSSTPGMNLPIPNYGFLQPKKYIFGSGDNEFTFMCVEGSIMSECGILSKDNLYDEYERVFPCNDDKEKPHDVIDDVDIMKRDTQNKEHILMSVSDNNPDSSLLDCIKIKHEGFIVHDIDSNGNRVKKFIKLKDFRPLPFVVTYSSIHRPKMPEPNFTKNENINTLVEEKVLDEKVNEICVSDKIDNNSNIDLITRLNLNLLRKFSKTLFFLKFKDVPNDEIIYCDNFTESSVVNEFIYCDKFKSCSLKYLLNNYNVDLSYDKPPDIYRFINHYNYGNVELNLDKPPDKWFVKKNLAHIKDMFVLNVELSYNKPPDIDEFIYDTFAKLVLKYNVVY